MEKMEPIIDLSPKRKIIQIVTSSIAIGSNITQLIGALADDGTVWALNGPQWTPCPAIPQGPPVYPEMPKAPVPMNGHPNPARRQ